MNIVDVITRIGCIYQENYMRILKEREWCTIEERIVKVIHRKLVWGADKAATCIKLTVSSEMSSMYIRNKTEIFKECRKEQ